MAIGGIGNSISVTLSPYIKDIADRMASFGKSAVAAFNNARPAVTAFFEQAIPVIDTAWTGLKSIASAVADLPANFEAAFPGVLSSLTGIGSAIKEWVLDKLELVGIVWRNLPAFVEIAALKIQEQIIHIGEYAATIPENLGRIGAWIGNEWVHMIQDALNAISTMFMTLGSNLGNLAVSLKDWAMNPFGGFKLDWKPLLADFKATTAAMPELMAPTLTSLQDQIDDKLSGIAVKELCGRSGWRRRRRSGSRPRRTRRRTAT